MTTCNLEVYKPFTETEYLDLRQAVDEISLAAIDEHIIGRLFATIDAAQAKAEHYRTCRVAGILAERDAALAEAAQFKADLETPKEGRVALGCSVEFEDALHAWRAVDPLYRDVTLIGLEAMLKKRTPLRDVFSDEHAQMLDAMDKVRALLKAAAR